MFYMTDLDDNTQLVLEAEASGAFAKSELEVRPNPQRALLNAVDTARKLANFLAGELRPTLDAAQAEAEILFSIKADGNGMVMVGMRPSEGQLQCTLRFRPSKGRPLTAPAAPHLGELPSPSESHKAATPAPAPLRASDFGDDGDDTAQ